MTERFTVENMPHAFNPEDPDADLTSWGILDHEEGEFAGFGSDMYLTVFRLTDELNRDARRKGQFFWRKVR